LNMPAVYAVLFVLVLSLFSASTSSSSGLVSEGDASYSYSYRGQQIVLQPSDSLIAISADAAGLSAFSTATDWNRDPLSDNAAAREHGFMLFRGASSDPKSGQWQSAADTLSATQRLAIPTQPVFEQGGAIQIPSDEVIVGFDYEVSAEEAWDLLYSQAPAEGLLDLRPLRRKTFVVTISDAEGGRAFAVSRTLAPLSGVAFAEPNFVVIHLTEPRGGGPRTPDEVERPDESPLEPLMPAPGLFPAGSSFQTPASQAPFSPVGWNTLVSEGFESGAPPGWTVSWSGVNALPVTQSARKHSGNVAVYMTGGGSAGVPPPGPYPNNSYSTLYSPVLNLASFEEAYVELWFYAKYEDPGASLWDYGQLILRDTNTSQLQSLNLLNVAYTGDLTADPTTQNGWRRVLARVPPAWRRAGVRVGIRFVSDSSVNREGLYIDDVRVVGTTNVDTEPLGNDTYGARVYELKNSGQIANLGNDTNDLNVPEAWAQVAVSSGVVVAVIDNGVDLSHPDLNLVTGYDGATGQAGGGPKSASDNHGTACAGNVGAKRNNGIGTIGTAPGVKIMPIHWGSTNADVANTFDLAVQHGADVLSNSWGWVGSPSGAITAAIEDALAARRTVVFAAGNGPDRSPWSYTTAYPCNLTATTDVICVGASSPTDQHKNASSSDGEFSWGSSYVGAGPDVVAPGSWSYTTDRQGALGYNGNSAVSGIDVDYTHDFGGTSSSTPKVAGIVALLLSKNPGLSPSQVKSILRNSAHDIDAAGVDDRTGAGRVNALATLIATPRFNDVPSSYWAWPHIEAIANVGVTTGCGPSIYCPGNPVSRAEMAAFLLRSIYGGGYSPPTATGTRFSDVPASYWAAAWIEQLATEGITLGCGGGRYCPESTVTRAEMAVFLLRSKHGSTYQPPAATGTMFRDVARNYWAASWIEQLASEGITGGCGNGNYCPDNSVTRAEMAVFLARTFNFPLPPRP